MANSSPTSRKIKMIGLPTMSIGVLARSNYVFVSLAALLFLVRFVDCDMLVRYHWGHGVGHTYAYDAHTAEKPKSQAIAMGADTVAALSVPPESEDPENNVSQQEIGLSREDGDDSDESSLGEDDMVFLDDSDGSMSGDGTDGEVCSWA
jgi:hypothetical protein